jgi:glycosyltransferase involved in cell wall biosynthesis
MQKEKTVSELHHVNVIIPAFNEEEAIEKVVKEIPSFVNEIIVVDNASNDQTGEKAKSAGASVLQEYNPGYGYACLKGIAYCNEKEYPPEIIVFMDGDHSDYPEEIKKLVNPVLNDEADLVIGARTKNLREKGSMTFPQVFGNTLATRLMKIIFPQSPFTDLGPFRVIKLSELNALNMQDKTYGWTVEMQLKALKNKLKCKEIPVHYRNRIGVSKVSGTLKGTIFAGVKILMWIFKYAF